MDRRVQAGGVAVGPFEAGEALHAVPAKVGAGVLRAKQVDLFPVALTDIANVKQSAVESGAPWVAQAKGKDFGCAAAGGERVAGRNGIGGGVIDINPQDLAQQPVGVLRVAEFIATAAAIAGADVKIAVRAKAQPAAVVIGGLIMWHGQKDAQSGRVGGAA